MSTAQTGGPASPESDTLNVTVRDCTPRWSLRVAPADAAAMGTVLGVELPLRIGAVGSEGPRSALCLGPDDWLLIAPELPDLSVAPLHALTGLRIASRRSR